ncbi:MAG: hypothetical protein IH858_04130 [Chloroflexi bacterium]|nr:hypothetical protein [Chloroflexota bacterium]
MVLVGPDSDGVAEGFSTELEILAPEMVGSTGSEYAVSGELILDGEVYLIGDEIADASRIKLGATEEAPLGGYGYGVLRDDPAFRLIWLIDEDGTRRNMIVHENDPLFSGDDGFRKHLEDYESGTLKAASASGIALSGAVPIVVAGLGLCIPSVGTTCLIGAIGGLATMVGGVIGDLYFTFAEAMPALRNMRADIDVIEANRGIISGG